MNILALDLGTNAGFAHTEGELGTWKLATTKEIALWGKNRMRRRLDPRVPRFVKHVKRLACISDVVVFEDVQFSSSTCQTQLWGSFRGALWWTCHEMNVMLECVPTGTLKLFAAGHGAATKEMMIAAANRAEPGKFIGLDDNAVDAYWILKWAEKSLSRMTKT